MRRSTLLQRLKQLEPGIPEKELFARILCGEIAVDGVTVRFPGERVSASAAIGYLPRRRFVSRGGEKLERVLERWRLDVTGLSFLDAGASTGGFTDCLLQRGARAVIAVEKGFNQLDFRLRQDSRVTVLEKTNIMELTAERLPIRIEAAVADLSLRSLRSAAAHILSLVPAGWLVALVKPQYERSPAAGSRDSGVVRNRDEVLGILRRLVFAFSEEGLSVLRGAPSYPVGARGNREFFLQIRRTPDPTTPEGHRQGILQELEELVAEAFPG